MIEISLAKKERDRSEALQLAREIFPSSAPSFSSNHIILIAKFKKYPIGFLHIIPKKDKLILQGLGVKDSVRNRGVATMLLAHAVDLFSQTNLPVFLKVKPLNPVVLLYATFGFFLKQYGQDVCIMKWGQNS